MFKSETIYVQSNAVFRFKLTGALLNSPDPSSAWKCVAEA